MSQFGPVDAYLDISPSNAGNSTHLRSCFTVLKQYGRASLMGTIANDIPIPYSAAVIKSLTIRGQFMYEREHVRGLIKLAESGGLSVGKSGGQEIVGQYKLEDVPQAFEAATANQEVGKMVLLTP